MNALAGVRPKSVSPITDGEYRVRVFARSARDCIGAVEFTVELADDRHEPKRRVCIHLVTRRIGKLYWRALRDLNLISDWAAPFGLTGFDHVKREEDFVRFLAEAQSLFGGDLYFILRRNPKWNSVVELTGVRVAFEGRG